jgi:hypothetical protein
LRDSALTVGSYERQLVVPDPSERVLARLDTDESIVVTAERDLCLFGSRESAVLLRDARAYNGKGSRLGEGLRDVEALPLRDLLELGYRDRAVLESKDAGQAWDTFRFS